ncbi:FecR domain-containing protein [Novosphingobium sp.]|uniref:FecR family protein n=1 Tax=Novosphingobium sp. TaxID=1874826 RepID=UPI0031E42DDF
MSADLSPSQEARITEAAAAWVAKARTSGLSASEKAEFLSWLRERPEHAAAADLASQAWAAAPAVMGQVAVPRPARTHAAARLWRPLAAGSMALGLVIAATLGWRAGCHDLDLATGTGQQRLAMLPDGSRLWLAPQTRAQVAITPLARAVRLAQGEAVFDVVHQWRPFRVTAGDLTVVDRGTLFGVRNRHAGEVSVVLAHGAVELRDTASDTPLLSPRPGEQARRDGQGMHIAPVDAQGLLDWRQGRLVFDHLPLGEALDRFAEQGAPRVRLADPSLARQTVSGAYDIADIASFLDGLTAIMPVRVAHERQGYVIERR